MTIKSILQLGNPVLYQPSTKVLKNELSHAYKIVQNLHDTLINFQKKHGYGRAIAAPQIGELKRIIYVFWKRPYVFINPTLKIIGKKKMILWDDCMSFPQLLVKLMRSSKCRITYYDLNFKKHTKILTGSWSELLQHEYDHLGGILAIQRMLDNQSIALCSQREGVKSLHLTTRCRKTSFKIQ